MWKTIHQFLNAGSCAALDPAALNNQQKDLRRKTHETLQKVDDDYGRRNTFNTAIAAVMELLNAVNKLNDTSEQGLAVVKEALEVAVLALAPITPHVSHKLWIALGHNEPVIDAQWPQVDEKALEKSSLEIVIQVNGKMRGKQEVAADADKETIEKLALENENVKRFTEGKTIRKVIVVPGKLINIVAN